MGGALSIASAVLVPEVDAVVAFYGIPSSELADPANAKAPIQAHFGELDSFVGFSDVMVMSFLLYFSVLIIFGCLLLFSLKFFFCAELLMTHGWGPWSWNCIVGTAEI